MELIERQKAIDVVAKLYRYESDRMTALQELPIIETNENRKNTYIDRIQNMTSEELARFIWCVLHNEDEYGEEVLTVCFAGEDSIEMGDNPKDIKEWLESEVKNN